jgi:hypothetical protein
MRDKALDLAQWTAGLVDSNVIFANYLLKPNSFPGLLRR